MARAPKLGEAAPGVHVERIEPMTVDPKVAKPWVGAVWKEIPGQGMQLAFVRLGDAEVLGNITEEMRPADTMRSVRDRIDSWMDTYLLLGLGR